MSNLTNERKNATEYTRAANRGFAKKHYLDFDEKSDFEDTRRGFIAKMDGKIEGKNGGTLWDWESYRFLAEEQNPDTVNPSLWRQARLNATPGLYKVTDGVYQVRGYDISIITFIEGKNSYLVIDPITSEETARACRELLFKHIGERPIQAVVYTHSHVDHWAGVNGVVNIEDVRQGTVRIIAPEGFMGAAVSENILAGNAMTRRGEYMFGAFLPRDARGQVDGGIGKMLPGGTIGLIAPTDTIRATGDSLTIDGVELVFQLVPNTEAPAEMNVFLPGHRALLMAEICSRSMHNLYTIRGAEVRDAKGWAHYIDEAIERYAPQADVVFTTHGWPVWGTEQGIGYLKKQRDGYKYIHDQTLRLANQGYTMLEIAEKIQLPKSLEKEWAFRGTYGTLHHNSKAVYNRYLGFYDGNPATLFQLPPEDAGKKYVEFMGGAAAVLEKAQAAFEKGEYRWAAQVVNHLVFAEPENEEARLLQADALEQLGYQAESAPWRNAFLSGAWELRHHGAKRAGGLNAKANMAAAMDIGNIFDSLAVRLDGLKAEGKELTINFDFTDIGRQYVLKLENSVLNYWEGKQAADADLSVTLSKKVLIELLLGKLRAAWDVVTQGIKFSGDIKKLAELAGLLDRVEPGFNIVTP
ncbi:SDS hydrolase SdsA1 [Spirochaetia bacterium]|nr:SDS hydrolase SdsA1 [Spirochaetia bacterium]